MAKVIDVIFVDERTGEIIPMSDGQKRNWKQKLLDWVKGMGLIFVSAVVYGYGTGGGGFRISRIEFKYIDPRTGKQLNA
jgi:hypothetical protein